MPENGGLISPLNNDFIIDGNPKYLLYKWVKVGQKPERLPGYTFHSSNNYKQFNEEEYRQITYCKYFCDKKIINKQENTFKFHILPDYEWK